MSRKSQKARRRLQDEGAESSAAAAVESAAPENVAQPAAPARQMSRHHKTALEALHDKAGPDTVVRIELLEGVRGFLASWVMFGHFILFLAIASLLPADSPSWLRPLLIQIREGSPPVSIFMMISGFVICHLLVTRREPYRVYITRRFLRLFPGFACCLLIGILVSPAQSELSSLMWGKEGWVAHQAELGQVHRDYMLQNIIAHLTMFHGLVPRSWWPDATGAFLGIGWSISTEWQFYLLAPFAIGFGKKLPGLAVICLVIAALSPAFPVLGFFSDFVNDSFSLIVFQIQYFFIGGVSYAIWRMWRDYLAKSSQPRPQGLVLCGAAIAFFVPSLPLACWVFLFACLLQIAAAPNGVESQIVQAIGCSKPAMFIGRISYSIYLVHWPLSILMLKLTKGLTVGMTRETWPTYLAEYMSMTFVLTVLVSSALYYFVEAPMIRLGKKMFHETGPVAG